MVKPYTEIISELSSNEAVFKSLLKGIDKEMCTWKPDEMRWSLLEIVCHLHDEEREDFRARLKHVLENPELPLPAIDPPGWVTQREYSMQDYDAMVDRFLDERKQSVHWLKGLKHPTWNNEHVHPKFGAMSGNLFLSNWLGHDYLHIRQILKIKFDYLKHISGETLSYAGEW